MNDSAVDYLLWDGVARTPLPPASRSCLRDRRSNGARNELFSTTNSSFSTRFSIGIGVRSEARSKLIEEEGREKQMGKRGQGTIDLTS